MPVDPRIQAILDAPMTTPTDLRFKPMRGHVMPPGTGPVGQTCRTCRHRSPTSSTYKTWTCGLVRGADASPIRLHERACGRWEAHVR